MNELFRVHLSGSELSEMISNYTFVLKIKVLFD